MNNPFHLKDACPGARGDSDSAGRISHAWSALLGRFLRLSLDETRVAKRGFRVESTEIANRLELIGCTFATGYNHAIATSNLCALVHALERIPIGERGFAYEGAAMGLALTDSLTPGRSLFECFLTGPADHHEYMVWVGLGWSFARLPFSQMHMLSQFRTPNKWLALDGYGFHVGYFDWRRSVLLHKRPRSVTGVAAKVFDQGLGRSLWFVCGADPKAIANTIATFEPHRIEDLWAGVGLSATYAGGVSRQSLADLTHLAQSSFPALAQGVVFAAQARRRAGNPVPHAEEACEEILGMALIDAANIAVECFPRAGYDIGTYQRWRADIQARFDSSRVALGRNAQQRMTAP